MTQSRFGIRKTTRFHYRIQMQFRPMDSFCPPFVSFCLSVRLPNVHILVNLSFKDVVADPMYIDLYYFSVYVDNTNTTI